MKIRSGFVSNSSSTSFVVTAKQNEFNEVLKESPDVVKYLINTKYAEVQKAFGFNIIIYMGLESSEDIGYELDDFVGDVIDINGNVLKTLTTEETENDENEFDLYNDDEAIISELRALRYIKKQMDKKGHDCILTTSPS